MTDKRPKAIDERMAKHSAGAVVFLIMGIMQWIMVGSVYAALPGVLIALILIVLKERFRRKVRREGFCWKRYKVIDYTYLTCLHKNPTGFVALSFDEGEPIKRYHFALAGKMETPDIGEMIYVCIPGNVRISEINGNNYVSEYYEIKREASR